MTRKTMLTEDYLVRLISQIIAALVKITQLRLAGNFQEARQMINQSLEQLIGLRADLLWQLDDDSLLQALTQGGRLDVDRLQLVGDLFLAGAELELAQERDTAALQGYLRALNVYLEAALSGGSEQPELNEKITGVFDRLSLSSLPDDTLWAWYCYQEARGAYTEAERALKALATRPGLGEELQPEMEAFSARKAQRQRTGKVG